VSEGSLEAAQEGMQGAGGKIIVLMARIAEVKDSLLVLQYMPGESGKQ